MSQFKIEILAFADCPNVEQARLNVQNALAAEDVSASITYIEVDTPEAAIAHQFLGSPSVRINGSDVEGGAGGRLSYGLMCRTYANGGADLGAPSVEMIRGALQRQSGLHVRFRVLPKMQRESS